jgi:hypothetical protein
MQSFVIFKGEIKEYWTNIYDLVWCYKLGIFSSCMSNQGVKTNDLKIKKKSTKMQPMKWRFKKFQCWDKGIQVENSRYN